MPTLIAGKRHGHCLGITDISIAPMRMCAQPKTHLVLWYGQLRRDVNQGLCYEAALVRLYI